MRWHHWLPKSGLSGICKGLLLLALAQQMSAGCVGRAAEEELTIRALYAQFVIGFQVSSMRTGTRAELFAIRLSRLRSGPLEAIMKERLDRIVTIPSGEVLMNMPGQWSVNGQRLCALVDVQGWSGYEHRYRGVETVDWQSPISEVVNALNEQNGQMYDRFVAYSVDISHGGKRRRYKALALLQGKEGAPFIMDYVIDGANISFVAQRGDLQRCLTVLPDVVDRDMRSAAMDFVGSLRVPSDCCSDHFTGLCCEPEGGKCGIQSEGR
jgi:hypothetical protein